MPRGPLCTVGILGMNLSMKCLGILTPAIRKCRC